MIRIHKEGKKIILGFTLLFMVGAVISLILFRWVVYLPVIILGLLLTALITRFFRVPRRKSTLNPGMVIAPADGTVVAVEKVEEGEYFKDERVLVSIFMSIYNVHINWYPIGGKIIFFRYHPGKYLVARHPKSSLLNERTTIVIESDETRVLVRQIAGYVARRIVCYAGEDKEVSQSEEMGFIKFGSRLDVYLPPGTNIMVKPGDQTIGGITGIARI